MVERDDRPGSGGGYPDPEDEQELSEGTGEEAGGIEVWIYIGQQARL